MAPPASPKPAAPPKLPAASKPGAPVLRAFHEVVAAAIGLSIAAVALSMVWRTYGAAVCTDTDAFARHKDIMLYGVSLLSAVMGYYFGRMPAERRAERAEQTSDAATRNATTSTAAAAHAQQDARDAAAARKTAEQKVARARQVVADVAERIPSQIGPDVGAEGATSGLGAQLAEVRIELAGLARSLEEEP